jgi:large subunit ribosomal protein L18
MIRIQLKNKNLGRVTKRLKNRARIRKKVVGSHVRPRLCVFRSGRHIYAQVVDDTVGKTLVSFSTLEGNVNKKNLEAAKHVGAELAKRALEKNIKDVVFDRSGYVFHGRIKAVAEGAREGGLSF